MPDHDPADLFVISGAQAVMSQRCAATITRPSSTSAHPGLKKNGRAKSGTRPNVSGLQDTSAKVVSLTIPCLDSISRTQSDGDEQSDDTTMSSSDDDEDDKEDFEAMKRQNVDYLRWKTRLEPNAAASPASPSSSPSEAAYDHETYVRDDSQRDIPGTTADQISSGRLSRDIAEPPESGRMTGQTEGDDSLHWDAPMESEPVEHHQQPEAVDSQAEDQLGLDTVVADDGEIPARTSRCVSPDGVAIIRTTPDHSTITSCASMASPPVSPSASLSLSCQSPEEGKAGHASGGGYCDLLQVLDKIELELDGSASRCTASPVPMPSPKSHSHTSGSSTKMDHLLSYLDTVVEKEYQPSSSGAVADTGANHLRMPPKLADLSRESSVKLAEQVVGLQYSLEERDRAIVVLKEALEHQRKLSANFTSRFQKELESRLASQKSEYESAITRHQNFIDQLIEDKKSLSEKCDSLSLELKHAEQKYQDAMKNAEQRHLAEMKRLKAMQESSNKLKQEKWLDEKTKRIKEQTVRGLEPEIQRLMARHSAELADVESERDRRLAALERELHQRHAHQVRELRAQWEEDQQHHLQRERQALNQRTAQQLEDQQQQHSQELERLQDLLRRERQRCAEDRVHYERETEQIRKLAGERAQVEIDRIKEEEETKRKILTKKHANELTILRENENSERAAWERDCRTKLDEEWKSRESGLREQYRKERDLELDRAVEKLEAEVIRGRSEVEKEYQERMKRLKVKYENEVEDLSRELDAAKEKANKSRDDAAKKEEELIVLSAILKQKEMSMQQLEQVNERLEMERQDVRQAVRGEFASALESLTNERASLLQQLADLRLKVAEMQSEKDTAEKQWRLHAEEEAEKIHSKVRAAIQKKDEAIGELRRLYDHALEQCQHLEVMLQRQTKVHYLKSSNGRPTKTGQQ